MIIIHGALNSSLLEYHYQYRQYRVTVTCQFYSNLSLYDIRMDKYMQVREIGEGAFGKAILVRVRDTGRQLVVKEVNMAKVF